MSDAFEGVTDANLAISHNDFLKSPDIAIKAMKTSYDEKSEKEIALLEITLPQDITIDAVICNLGRIDGVSQLMQGIIQKKKR